MAGTAKRDKTVVFNLQPLCINLLAYELLTIRGKPGDQLAVRKAGGALEKSKGERKHMSLMKFQGSKEGKIE